MLLTLTVTSLKSFSGTGTSVSGLTDLPSFARQQLGLHGLNISTELLKGVDRATLAQLRDASDKARCACLLLIEPAPLAFGTEDEEKGMSAVERTNRVVEAAHVLGCNAAAISVESKDNEGSFDRAAERLRMVMEQAERREMNLLIAPTKGLTETPERTTELIKKVGGFRIGTLPDFESASGSGDAPGYLRRLTPYASIVIAATQGFTAGGKAVSKTEITEVQEDLEHPDYNLKAMVDAVLSVGYDGTLAIDYRGDGDCTLGVLRSRAVLEAAMEQAAEEG